MKSLVVFVIAALLLAGCPEGNKTGGGGPATVAVSGIVLDSAGDPVAGATVTIASDPVITQTDATGAFSAQIEPGAHHLMASKGGVDFVDMDLTVMDGEPLDLGDITPTMPYMDPDGDADVDGITNTADACPGTPAGEVVDANGCSDTQLDDDGDGVSDAADSCPGTPAGEAVDMYGCSASQRDSDGDGLSDADEAILGTDPTKLDTDGDGLLDGDEMDVLGTDPTDALSVPGVEPVSVDNAGVEGDSESSVFEPPALSADGRYVAFQSNATNLVDGDVNNAQDIFVHDRETGQTTRVSVTELGGLEADGPSEQPSISADGRYVAFASSATNISQGDINNAEDIFVRDRQTGHTFNMSVGQMGALAVGGDSVQPAISANGRFIAFQSDATNIVDGDDNNVRDIFVADREDYDHPTRVSVGPEGAQSRGGGYRPSISADGRYVAFYSFANDLLDQTDDNVAADVFVHDRLTGVTELVSANVDGNVGNGASFVNANAISADGRYVTFYSFASDLVDDTDDNGFTDVFVRDRKTAQTTRVAVGPGGALADARSYDPTISADGRYVSFTSPASNFGASTTNICVHDLVTGVTQVVPINGGVETENLEGDWASISAGGRYLAFAAYDMTYKYHAVVVPNTLSRMNLGADDDGDGLTNREELVETFTRFFIADTDGDGVDDGAEVAAGTDPLDPADF